MSNHEGKGLEKQKKYPESLSRSFGEGGYTFLHRVFRTHFDSGKPVVINTGKLYIQYKFEPHHTTFSEGVTVIDGEDKETLRLFLSVADAFSLDQAFRENKIERPEH